MIPAVSPCRVTCCSQGLLSHSAPPGKRPRQGRDGELSSPRGASLSPIPPPVTPVLSPVPHQPSHCCLKALKTRLDSRRSLELPGNVPLSWYPWVLFTGALPEELGLHPTPSTAVFTLLKEDAAFPPFPEAPGLIPGHTDGIRWMSLIPQPWCSSITELWLPYKSPIEQIFVLPYPRSPPSRFTHLSSSLGFVSPL